MDKTILTREIVDIIIREIHNLRGKNNIVNPVLRNDVFALLESQECTVLYYPLDDEIEGFRTRKYVNGRDEEFIYINTAKPEDIQIFTAAHELGHLINIDQIVWKELGIPDMSKKMREDIIDRFAAELLMERDSFVKMFWVKVRNYVDEKKEISRDNMVKTIAFLMDFFMVPYDAVVRRLYETDRISEKIRDYLLNRKNVSTLLIEKAIEDGKYKRLKPTQIKSFGELPQLLEKLDEAGAINERRMLSIMEVFGIKAVEAQDASSVDMIQLEKDISDE